MQRCYALVVKKYVDESVYWCCFVLISLNPQRVISPKYVRSVYQYLYYYGVEAQGTVSPEKATIWYAPTLPPCYKTQESTVSLIFQHIPPAHILSGQIIFIRSTFYVILCYTMLQNMK